MKAYAHSPYHRTSIATGVPSLNARRSLNLTDYLALPPEDMELNDENVSDSLESMVDPSGSKV